MPQKIEISYKTIIFTVAFLLGLWSVWSVKGIIMQLFVSVVLMTAFSPWVNRVEKIKIGEWKMPRSAAILIVYLGLFLLLSEFIALVSQPLIIQTTNLVRQLPGFLATLDGWGVNQSVLNNQLGQLTALPGNLVKVLGGIFSNILNLFTILMVTFYLLLERDRLHKHLTFLFENLTLEKRVEKFINQLEFRLGGWVRAEAMLMVIVGVLCYVGLVMLGIPYALPLAIFAGLLEVIPNIGPFFSAIPAVLVGLLVSPLAAVGVAALYLLVQLLENNLIVPQVMSRTIGINPLVTVVALLIGFELDGVRGAILAVPAVLALREGLRMFGEGKWKKGEE